MFTRNYQIFSENYLYKTKITKIFKVTSVFDEEFFFLFLETHNQEMLIILNADKNDINYDNISFITKKDFYEYFEEEDDLDNLSFNDFNIKALPKKVEVYKDALFLEVYQNDENYFLSNILFIKRHKFKLNLNEKDFIEISTSDAIKGFSKMISNFRLSDDDLIKLEEKKVRFTKEIFKNPEKIKFLYKIETRTPLVLQYNNEYVYDDDEIIVYFIFRKENTLFYARNDIIVDKNVTTYSFFNPYIVEKIYKIENKEEYIKLLKEYIKENKTKVKYYIANKDLELLNNLSNEYYYNLFTITAYKDKLKIVEKDEKNYKLITNECFYDNFL